MPSNCSRRWSAKAVSLCRRRWYQCSFWKIELAGEEDRARKLLAQLLADLATSSTASVADRHPVVRVQALPAAPGDVLLEVLARVRLEPLDLLVALEGARVDDAHRDEDEVLEVVREERGWSGSGAGRSPRTGRRSGSRSGASGRAGDAASATGRAAHGHEDVVEALEVLGHALVVAPDQETDATVALVMRTVIQPPSANFS